MGLDILGIIRNVLNVMVQKNKSVMYRLSNKGYIRASHPWSALNCGRPTSANRALAKLGKDECNMTLTLMPKTLYDMLCE